jgi:hypothetical protein
MMKIVNLLLVIFLFNLIAVSVSAQLTKGSTWLGGSANYSSNVSEAPFSSRTKTQSFNISPAIGKVVKPGLVTGIEFLYSSAKEERNNPSYENKNKFYGAGIFARKYIETFKKLYLFGHAGLGGGINRANTSNNFPGVTESNGWQAGVSLYPGISYALSSKVFLEAAFINLFMVNYSSTKTKIQNDVYKNSNFSASVNFNNASNFGLGIRFILPGGSSKKTN